MALSLVDQSRSVSSIDPKSLTAPSDSSRRNAVTPAQILSTKPLSEWYGSLTGFDGFTGTHPVLELNDVSWDEIRWVIAPKNPSINEDKSKGKFVVPCLLKEAPLVGKTLEVAIRNNQPTIGKMRSKQHVTHASWLIIDCDGLPLEEFEDALELIREDGLTVLAFTTHSHGREDKPGVRARIVIPVDRPLTVEEYAEAWYGFDARYFGGAQ